ncbi:MAG: tetratricopeptide repeat protein [Myxococcota bacterium]
MTHCRPSLFVAFLAALALLPNAARAQDMEFSVDDAGDGDADEEAQPAADPPEAGEPSEDLKGALVLYEKGDYTQAAIELQKVIDGETNDDEGNKQRAQFFLAKAMFHLKFFQPALANFDEITELGQGHLYFDASLQWLAQLATELPEPAGIIEKVGRYGLDQLEQFDTAENEQLYNHLLYLMGRHKYDQGAFEEAIELFTKVEPSSDYYVKAKFFEGITHVRERQARPAIAAFRAIVEGIDEGDVEAGDEEDRLRNLAWISLARVYYTASNRTDPETGEQTIDGRLLGQAVESWNQVEQGSEYWLDAVFESSWAFFLADEYSRALGNVHTLYSPYFRNAYYPEALVLKAVTFFVNCQMENAEATVYRFHERFDPVKKELDEVLARFQDNTEFFEFLKRVRTGEADLSPRIRGIVASALSDRTVLAHLEYARILDAEEERLEQASKAFQDSSAGSRVLQDVAIAKSFAIDETGDLVRGRYERLIRELQDLMNQIDAVDLEVATYQRGQLTQRAKEQMTAAAESEGGQVEVDEEHQLWPFDGEYWRDELGFYRQQVTNQCGR